MISTSSFYNGRKSSRDETREEKYQTAEKKVKLAYLPSKTETSLFGPSPILQVFNKQDDALKFAEEKSELDLMVFSKEVNVGGERVFVVSDRENFWNHYQTIPLLQRNFYEIIPKNKPCKLYFDLEFMKRENVNKDGEFMTNNLISKVMEKIWTEFSICCYFEDVLILDSTTEEKFSIHLIFNNNSLVFADNEQAGNFVRKFVHDLNSEDRRKLEICSEGRNKLLIDQGVYTKNSNFRMFLSTKFGKQRNLCISSMDLFSVRFAENNQNVEKRQFEKSMFMSSLITNNEEMCQSKLIHCIKGNLPKLAAPSSIKTSHQASSGESPFVEVDKFVHSLVFPGFIRKWIYFQDSQTILYEIGGNRFCGNVGREHRSNNVMFLADLNQGQVFQKCHDPDCSGYRSTPILLPESTLPWNLMEEWNGEGSDDINNGEAEDSDESCDVFDGDSDDILLEIVENYEKQQKIPS